MAFPAVVFVLTLNCALTLSQRAPQVRSIPREDVAEVMVMSLLVNEMSSRSLDLCSEEGERKPSELMDAMMESVFLGNCDYGISPGQPISQF